MGIDSTGNPKLPTSIRTTLAGAKLGVTPTGRLQAGSAALGRDTGAIGKAAAPAPDPLAAYAAKAEPGAFLASLGEVAPAGDAKPKIQGSLQAFLAACEAGLADGSLSPADLATLEARAEGVAGKDYRAWAKQALDDVKAQSTQGPDGALTPRNDVVKALVKPARLEAIAERLKQADAHPVLETIQDPAARDAMREYLKRYMTDPVFMAVHDERTLNYGPWNNFKQTIGSAFSERSIGDGRVDGLFGGCVECQARTLAVFRRFEQEWKQDPANAGKAFPLEAGSMQTRNAVAFEHNFAFVKAASGETFYVDPWGAQDTTKDTIRTKQAWLDDMKDGAFGLVLGEGNITWVYEGGREVYNPGQGDMAL